MSTRRHVGMIAANPARSKRDPNTTSLVPLGRVSDPIEAELLAAKGADTLEKKRLHAELQHRMFGEAERPLMFGRFTVVRKLGEGAMGLVYLVYDPVLDRKVALKLLHPIAQSKLGAQADAALTLEARAIARLAHPNVVTVFEVGEADGRAFLSMEFVEGEDVAHWLRREHRTRDQILEVFIGAGRGLAAAHEADIVHRDFKPQNVLVAADGRARVADFGLARERVEGVSESELTTGENVRSTSVAGTPAYMAPEVRDGFVATAAADQYSFCVALFEALVGHLPGNDAPKTRLPAALASALTRGLAGDPQQRHVSMAELLDRLERVRQGRGRAVITAVVALPIVASCAWWLGARTTDPGCGASDTAWADAFPPHRRAQLREQIERTAGASVNVERVVAALDKFGDRWLDARQDACARQETGQTSVLSELERACLARGLGEVETVVATLLDGDRGVVRRSAKLVDELSAPERCAERSEILLRARPPTDTSARASFEEIRSSIVAANVTLRAGRTEAALEELTSIEAGVRSLAHPLVDAEFALALGRAQNEAQDFTAARRALVDAHHRAVTAGDHRLAADAATWMANLVGIERARHDEGLDWARLAEAQFANLSESADARLRLSRIVAGIHYGKSEYEAAVAVVDASLRDLAQQPDGERQTRIRGSLHLVRANALLELGQIDAAIESQLTAAAEFKVVLGDAHPAVGLAFNNLASSYNNKGDHEEAARYARDALAVFEASRDAWHTDLALAHNNIGTALASRGEFLECLPHFQRAAEIWTRAFGEVHPNVANVSGNIALALVSLDRDLEALEPARKALELNLELLGEGHADVLLQRSNVGRILRRVGRHAEAKSEFQRVVAQWRRGPGPPPGQLGAVQMELGIAHSDLEEWPEALTNLHASVATLESTETSEVILADAHFFLGKALWLGSHDATEAKAHLRWARDWYVEEGETWKTLRLPQIDAFLAQSGLALR